MFVASHSGPAIVQCHSGSRDRMTKWEDLCTYVLQLKLLMSPYNLVYRTWSAWEHRAMLPESVAVPQLYPVVCKTELHTKNLMEKIMHLCFMSWCTEGVSALKVSQDTQLVDLETDCLTFETYWVQDKACRGLISRHDFHMLARCAWDRLSDFETDYLTSRQTACRTRLALGRNSETDCLIMRQTLWLRDKV